MKNKEDIENILGLWKERNEKEFSWVKHVISIIAIILGLLLTFKIGHSKDMTEYILFISAIGINGICILSGLIFLYSENDTVHSLILKYTDYLTIKTDEDGEQLIQAPPKRVYSFLRISFFIFLILSVLSLIAFAAYSNFPVETATNI
jgi:hypothetical protein